VCALFVVEIFFSSLVSSTFFSREREKYFLESRKKSEKIRAGGAKNKQKKNRKNGRNFYQTKDMR